MITASATAATEVLTVMFRPGRGAWQQIGTAANHRAALELVNGSGDWWFRRADRQDEQPTLFDEVEGEPELIERS